MVRLPTKKNMPLEKQNDRIYFSPNTTGKYIVILTDTYLGNQHAIGIDCDSYPKMIWDSYEEFSLPLSTDNLSRCCGRNEIFFNIRMMAEIFCTYKKEKELILITLWFVMRIFSYRNSDLYMINSDIDHM